MQRDKRCQKDLQCSFPPKHLVEKNFWDEDAPDIFDNWHFCCVQPCHRRAIRAGSIRDIHCIKIHTRKTKWAWDVRKWQKKINFTQTRHLTQWWLSMKAGRREIILKQGKTFFGIQIFEISFKLSNWPKSSIWIANKQSETKITFKNVTEVSLITDGCQQTLWTSMHTTESSTGRLSTNSSSSFPARIPNQLKFQWLHLSLSGQCTTNIKVGLFILYSLPNF